MDREGLYLEFRWTISRGRDTYGYNICSLYVNGSKVSSCNGGGYDMQGTALGNWIAREFRSELLALEPKKEELYGLTYHNPNYNPGDKVIAGKTVTEREKEGVSLGLERYQAFYSASSKWPSDKHTVPLIDGACGFSSVERILKAVGYSLKYLPTRRKNWSGYILNKSGR